MICPECNQEKEYLTKHGTCFRCHVLGVSIQTGCKNCKASQVKRIAHSSTSNVTVTQIKD